jgi:uncharacterized membrane protein YfcA
MEILVAALCGAVIGLILGLVGAGGSMIAVPMLIYIFSFSPVQATTASLLIVFAGAVAGLSSKFKNGDVLVRDGLVIWFFGLTTNFAGAYFLPQLPETLILTGFSLVLISAGASMLLKHVYFRFNCFIPSHRSYDRALWNRWWLRRHPYPDSFLQRIA